MSTPSNRRTRKRLATRESISDAATRLFFERGFDNVTIDEIAEVADVGRMTVFNHFARKEDLFFDRDEEGRELLRQALRQRPAHLPPVESLRLLAHRLVAEGNAYIEFSVRSQNFVAVIRSSETLKARARAIRDELAHILTVELAHSVGREPTDPDAHLASSLFLAAWTVAILQAHRTFERSQNEDEAKAAFLVIIDRGSLGLKASMQGTPYA